MLEWALDALRDSPGVGEIIVALPEGYDAPAGCVGVRGGAERSHSVRAALAASSGDPVLVQDAARPMLTPEIVAACLAAVAEPGVDAAIAAAPVTDTVKEARDGVVRRTLDRSVLWAVQTPQVFRRAVLEAALAQPDEVLAAATDDASLVEAAGGEVRIVPTSARNLKVTTPDDLQIAEMMLVSSSGHRKR